MAPLSGGAWMALFFSPIALNFPFITLIDGFDLPYYSKVLALAFHIVSLFIFAAGLFNYANLSDAEKKKRYTKLFLAIGISWALPVWAFISWLAGRD